MKVVSSRLGHATAGFAQDVYMRPLEQMERDAAVRTAADIFRPRQPD